MATSHGVIYVPQIEGWAAEEILVGETTVDPSEIKAIDTLAIDYFRSCKWMIQVNDTIKFKTFEIMTLVDGGDISHAEYGVLGEDIDYSLDVLKDSDNIILQITNHETSILNIKFKRINL